MKLRPTTHQSASQPSAAPDLGSEDIVPTSTWSARSANAGSFSPMEDALSDLLDIFQDMAGSTGGVIASADGAEWLVSTGLPVTVARYLVQWSCTLPSSRTVVNIQAESSLMDWANALREADLRFVWGAPLFNRRGELVGGAVLASPEPLVLDERVLRLLEQLRGQAGLLFDWQRDRVYCQQLRDQNQRAARLARQSERLLHDAFDRNNRPLYPSLLRAVRQRAQGMLIELAGLSAFGTDLGIILAQGQTLRGTIARCGDAMKTHLGIETLWVWLIDREGKSFEFQGPSSPPDTADIGLTFTGAAADACRHSWPLGDGGAAVYSLGESATHGATAGGEFADIEVAQAPLEALPPSLRSWCQDQRIAAIGRYPMEVNDRRIGTAVVLTRHPLSTTSSHMLEWAANSIAVVFDRFQAREDLLQRREKLMFRLSGQIHSSLDLDTILQTAVQEIRDLFHIDDCYFLWYLPVGETPNAATSHYSSRDGLDTLLLDTLPGYTSALARLILDLAPIPIHDTQTDDLSGVGGSLVPILRASGIASQLVVPLKTRSGQYGAIACSHRQHARQWRESEIELLQAAVDRLAIAIDQAELYAQARAAALAAQAQAKQLTETLRHLKETEAQLVQSEKMSSLGQMVAGVAHEINNPVSFIYGNLDHLRDYARDTLNLIALFQKHYRDPHPEIAALCQTIDLEFLIEDMPKLIHSIEMGTERIRQIVMSLRNFSRLDEAAVKQVNIHEGIDSTLLILQSRLKPSGTFAGVQVVKQYGELPLIECFAGQLNQVFMNILGNAIDALESLGHMGTITIKTEVLNAIAAAPDEQRSDPLDAVPTACIRISDNGTGISEEARSRLFDPFFTTKPVGKGTGLGLSICYQIIVDKHGGQLSCQSEPNQGTEFSIRIPITLPPALHPKH